MLDSRDGDKISPIAEPITLDDLTRKGIIEACSQSQGQPCVCGALVKCTAAVDELETVHITKKENGGAVKVANVEQLNERDIIRERPFSGCRFSEDGKCSTEEEYIEGKAWQGVDKSVKNDPNMKFKQRLASEALNLLPYVDVPDKDVWQNSDKNGKKSLEHWALNVNESYMICTHGYGLIYFENAGQSYVNTFLEEAECMVVPDESREEVELSSWLKAYEGEPDPSDGTVVTYSFEDREELKETNPNIDWYSYEDQSGKNDNCEDYLVGQEFIDMGNGVLVDQNGRYWVTLGPKVFISDYPDDGKCEADDFKDYIGCRVDVVLRHMEDEDKYVYIECVWSGDIKAHTFSNGIFQNGEPYPQSDIAKKQPYDKDYVNGSIVEFTGKDPEDTGDMSVYIVEYLIVYPKE